jgi:long-subunit acyl-CoA synthetase (AMP-forming)
MIAMGTFPVQLIIQILSFVAQVCADIVNQAHFLIFQVFAEIQKAVDHYNSNYASNSVESIKKWCLLSSEFSQASGELNNTFKLKRTFIEKKYERQINSMYDSHY